MGHNTGTRRGTAFAALGAVLLTLLVLASPALAGPPFHSREPARDITGLNHACGAATDSEGDVYASSAGESKIKVFNSSHVELKSITNANEPCGLAVDSKGHLYVSEKATGKVVKYTPNAYPFSAPLSYSGPVTVDSSGNAKGIAVDPSDDRLYVAEGNHVMVYQSDGTSGQNEVQEVSVIASTTGTFTLTFDGQTTAPLAFDATHAQVQAALEGLSTVGAGNVSVTGGPLGSRDHRVTFEGTLASTDVPGLVGNFSGLDFGGASEISTVTTGFAFNGIIGTGELSEATGVASYTYDNLSESNSAHYLVVADNSGDVVKVFVGKPGKDFKSLTLKQTLNGSQTPGGSFGFGTSGAYLAADQSNGHFFVYDDAHTVLDEFEASGQYLTQVKLSEISGYADAGPTAIASYAQLDELQRLQIHATGGTYTLTFKGETTEALSWEAIPSKVEAALQALPAIGAGNLSISAASLESSVPRYIRFTGALGKQDVPPISLDSSNLEESFGSVAWGQVTVRQGSGPGELYVTSGSSAGAKLFAFSPLTKPDRPAIPSLSRVLAGAKAVAVDSSGDVYVATASLIKVYDPSGAEIKVGAKGTGIATEKPPVDLAVDSAGRVYAMENPNSGDRATEKVQYYTPAAFPPKAGTLYSSAVTVATGNSFTTNEFLTGLEINSSNSHLFVANLNQIIELDSASKGSTVLNGTFASGVGIPAGIEDVAVNATNGNVYVPVGSGNGAVYVITSGGALISKIGGAGGPREGFRSGNLNAPGMIAVEPSNGHVLVFQNSRGSVEEYEPSGAFVASFGKFNTKIQPVFRIAVDSSGGPNNGDLYVAMDDPTAGVFDLAAFGRLDYGVAPPPPKEFKLTVSKSGTGTGTITSTPAGIDCGLDCSEVYAEGAKVTLTATPAGGSTFAGWSGSGCSGTGKCEVTMSEAKSVTAEFTAAPKPKFLFKVKKAGTGTGTVTSSPSGINCGLDCEEEYDEGTAITLTGAAGANSKAVVWTGCDSVNGENKCLVAMSSAKEVTATFALEAHLLTVSKVGSGSGKVTSTPAGIECGSECSASFDHGTLVSLSATPAGGSTFSGWSGSGCSGTDKCEVTMSEAKSVSASFDLEVVGTEFLLSVATDGSGTGTIASSPGAISCNPFCSDEFPEGAVVTLTATAAPGSIFYSWKHCDSGGVNGRQCTVAMSKAKTVSAVFITTYDLSVSKAPGSGLGKVQSSPGGILCLAGCSETTAAFKEGAAIALKQTPAKHFHFVGWLGDCTGSGACELSMGEDKEVEAEFAEDAKHLLTLSKTGGGNGTIKSSIAGINCGATCSSVAANYYAGEVVELTATPGKGSTFDHWVGEGCETNPVCTVTMNAATEVQAEFK